MMVTGEQAAREARSKRKRVNWQLRQRVWAQVGHFGCLYSSYGPVTYGPSALRLLMVTGLRRKVCENSELDRRYTAKPTQA